MIDHDREYRLKCAVSAMRHRMAAVILDAIVESGATVKAIVKATGASRENVLAVLRADDGPVIQDIVRVGLACGISFDLSMKPRVLPAMRNPK